MIYIIQHSLLPRFTCSISSPYCTRYFTFPRLLRTPNFLSPGDPRPQRCAKSGTNSKSCKGRRTDLTKPCSPRNSSGCPVSVGTVTWRSSDFQPLYNKTASFQGSRSSFQLPRPLLHLSLASFRNNPMSLFLLTYKLRPTSRDTAGCMYRLRNIQHNDETQRCDTVFQADMHHNQQFPRWSFLQEAYWLPHHTVISTTPSMKPRVLPCLQREIIYGVASIR